MKNQLTNSFSTETFSSVTNWFNVFIDKIETVLSTADNLHIVALILGALIFVTICCLIGFMTVCLLSFIFFRKKKKTKSSNISTAKEEPDTSGITEEDEANEKTLEDELQAELMQAEPNENSLENDVKQESSTEKEDLAAKEEVNFSKTDSYEQHHTLNEKQLIELDWKKTPRNQQSQAEELSLSIQQNLVNVRKNLHDLVGMIVNMIGRNIDELKIAQALMYLCQDYVSEETVLQIVRSVKEFLVLCNQRAFDNVRRMKDLPSDEDCILHLIAGDTSYAMVLMEALMDDRINQAVSMKNIAQRDALFKQSSNYACYFGTLAEINDVNLASASFELAIEMYPENPLAWSRSADLYKKIGMEDKANWAYRNVLRLIKQGENESQEANARKSLSQYMYAQGEGHQASQLYMQSKSYYDSIGINRPLDRKELEIIELIDRTEKEKIIESVLSHRQNSLSN